MKIGDKILVPNWIAFEKKSDAIAVAVNEIDGDGKIHVEGEYPHDCDGCPSWQYERPYAIRDIFVLDNITIVQINSNDTLLWVWKFKEIKNESEVAMLTNDQSILVKRRAAMAEISPETKRSDLVSQAEKIAAEINGHERCPFVELDVIFYYIHYVAEFHNRPDLSFSR